MAGCGVYFLCLLHLILFFTAGQSDDAAEFVSIILERFRQLDKRIKTEITFLRQELQTEISMMTFSPPLNKQSYLRREKDLNNMTNSFEKRVVNEMKSVKYGLAKEKIFRRDLQDQMRKMKEDQLLLERPLENLVQTLIHKLGEIELAITGTLKHGRLTDIVKPICESTLLEKTAKDCADLHSMGHVTSGVYSIHPDSIWRPLDVYCDMETDGGGWTVFQRRCDGSEDFYRDWMDYRFGFGNLTAEFWLGNEFIHRIVSMYSHELRIELEDFDKDVRYAKYLLFSVGSVDDGFRLTIDGFRGNVTDSFTGSHNGQQFSTKDRGPSKGCSKSYKGGFWYNKCHLVNLNGLYLKGIHESFADGVSWKSFRGYNYSLKYTEMKFRPK